MRFQAGAAGVSRRGSRMFKWCFMEVSMIIPECFKGASRYFQENVKVFQRHFILRGTTQIEGDRVFLKYRYMTGMKSRQVEFHGN